MDGSQIGAVEGLGPGTGTLQGEVAFLKSALIRTEGDNKKLRKEMSAFKLEFEELVTKLSHSGPGMSPMHRLDIDMQCCRWWLSTRWKWCQ